MSRPATSRLKVNPPLGRMPVLQFVPPAELLIDDTYQRSLDAGSSKTLIRKIAQFWNWDLCQPLVVSRRDNGDLFVIDGQHRLEAARMRGDIAQLPCVVVNYTCREDEAASFVHLNQQRRPLTKLDVFKAAVASGDEEACAITAAMAEAGLCAAPHQNYLSWKPGMVANIGGIERAWRLHGPRVASYALNAIGEALSGQVLRYAGTIFPGVAAVCADEVRSAGKFDPDLWPIFVEMVREGEQETWRSEIMRAKADDPNIKFFAASELVFRRAWQELIDEMMERAA